MRITAAMMIMALPLAACAGRTPQPVAVAQVQDATTGCAQIHSEIAANNQKIQALASEKGGKVAQNLAAGVGGLLFPPLWFAMDFQGAATTEANALSQRNQYLATMAQERCARSVAVLAP
jgi:hypothetical protein